MTQDDAGSAPMLGSVANGWIPVTDYLPEAYKRVIGCWLESSLRAGERRAVDGGEMSDTTETQDTISADVVTRIDTLRQLLQRHRCRRWLESGIPGESDSTLGYARAEIVSLRAMLARERQTAADAVRLTTDNASRYGFLLGGLEMAAAGHTTAAKVLASAKAKYGE